MPGDLYVKAIVPCVIVDEGAVDRVAKRHGVEYNRLGNGYGFFYTVLKTIRVVREKVDVEFVNHIDAIGVCGLVVEAYLRSEPKWLFSLIEEWCPAVAEIDWRTVLRGLASRFTHPNRLIAVKTDIKHGRFIVSIMEA